MVMAGRGRSFAVITAAIACLALGACDPSDPPPSNHVTAEDPRAPGEDLRDRLLAAVEPCVARVDRLVSDVSTKSLDVPAARDAAAAAVVACNRALGTVEGVGAPDAVEDVCNDYVADNRIVIDLTINSLRARSRDDRQRVQEALANRDRSREACTTAALYETP